MGKVKRALKNNTDILGNYVIAVLLVAIISIFYRGFGSWLSASWSTSSRCCRILPSWASWCWGRPSRC